MSPPVGAGLLGAALAALTETALRAKPPRGAGRWDRTNHAGRTVTLLEGPAYAVGSALAAGVTGGGAPALVAGLGGGALGAMDDHAGDSSSKGLRGHLQALRDGRVTTGAVKIVGLAATGLLAAVLLDRATAADPDRRAPEAPTPRSVLSAGLTALLGGAVVAGSANLLNLLDLRPGRALKVTVLLGLPLGIHGSATAAAAVGAALGCLPGDLAGRSMLGDTGANAAGALLGVAALERTGLRGRAATLVVLAGLTLASERVSFTKVIESTPVLRELDALGRPDVAAAPGPPPSVR